MSGWSKYWMTVAGGVTVLLLTLADYDGACAHGSASYQAADVNDVRIRLFEFTAEFSAGVGRAEGLVASDGTRSRLAIYWIEPVLLREDIPFFAYSDFLLGPEVAQYWAYGMSEPETLTLSDSRGDPAPSPEDTSPGSVIPCALAMMSRIQSASPTTGSPEIGKFFRESRGQRKCAYRIPPPDANALSGTTSVLRVLDRLPLGREYSKDRRPDGSVVWRAQTALDNEVLLTVTVKPVTSPQPDSGCGAFDATTLGKWVALPDPYRTYWSSYRAYSDIGACGGVQASAHELHDRIASYLRGNEMHACVRRALERLQFKTSLMADDMNDVCQSAQAYVAGLCQGTSTNGVETLLELARLVDAIEKRYAHRADAVLRALVRQVVERSGPAIARDLERIMPSVFSNNWFTYGTLLLEEVRRWHLVEERRLDALTAELNALHLARKIDPFDPNEATKTEREYLASLDCPPRTGSLDMNDIRRIVERGLGTCYHEGESEARHKVVEDVMRSIHLIAGDGPFRGDAPVLIAAIEHFGALYLSVFKIKEPIDGILATFLALSFCDNSTREDHDQLFAQLQDLCGSLQAQLRTIVTERGLDALVMPEDTEKMFQHLQEILRRYIDDPLWPTLKFPLTANEKVRLAHKLKLHLIHLEPSLEQVSLKLRYGGGSPELKERALHDIFFAVQKLLPEAGFLRRPPYPGLQCEYRAGYGFVALTSSPFYREGDRPREKFKAMKYFHLGHRLEEIVRQEAEWATSARKQELLP